MHRTQIYFEEAMFATLKQKADAQNISISAYIRALLKKQLESQENIHIMYVYFSESGFNHAKSTGIFKR